MTDLLFQFYQFGFSCFDFDQVTTYLLFSGEQNHGFKFGLTWQAVCLLLNSCCFIFNLPEFCCFQCLHPGPYCSLRSLLLVKEFQCKICLHNLYQNWCKFDSFAKRLDSGISKVCQASRQTMSVSIDPCEAHVCIFTFCSVCLFVCSVFTGLFCFSRHPPACLFASSR